MLVAIGLALALALANAGAYAAGLKIAGQRPDAGQIAIFSALMLVLAGGMWRRSYWAVLIMQALLAVAVLVFAMLLTVARNLQAAAECVLVIAVAGTLFWFLIRVMGRIQAGDHRPPSERTPGMTRERGHEA